MLKVVRKWFWAWNDDKEQQFLEDMALKGYRLVNVQIGRYTFKKGESRKVKYQLDFKGLGKISEADYLQLFEDAGWKCVHRLGAWYYFEKEYTDEEPDISIFNDNRSRIDKYRRIILFMLLTGFPLYYQVIFMFPGMDRTEFSFPGFYFFFRIIVTIFIVLHAAAMARIAYKIIKERKDIKE